MKMLERFAAVIETTAFLGPANLLSLLIAAGLSWLYVGYRLLSQGYCRFLFSSR